eukprot:CAMPEP_0179286254 /NCGR_PEP_ID=MMETSP0797-20121207/39644_1 /TAXON_ID=47934 /ORGANISM="Dinophysis acuminata, Strain DAEP01" /LENGTH=291 /DNA_ID=CAMNT_0020995127 /DNA_START=1 /DNA_END=873 /DNA_ORIENTATION=+
MGVPPPAARRARYGSRHQSGGMMSSLGTSAAAHCQPARGRSPEDPEPEGGGTLEPREQERAEELEVRRALRVGAAEAHLRVGQDALEVRHLQQLPPLQVEEAEGRHSCAEVAAVASLWRPRGRGGDEPLDEVGHPDHFVLVEVEGAEPLGALLQAAAAPQEPHGERLQRPPALARLRLSAGSSGSALRLLPRLVAELALEHVQRLRPLPVAEARLEPHLAQVREERLLLRVRRQEERRRRRRQSGRGDLRRVLQEVPQGVRVRREAAAAPLAVQPEVLAEEDRRMPRGEGG